MRVRLVAGFCCGCAACGASAAVAAAEGLHGHLTLGSDYVFRGISQTTGDPTVQGGLEYARSSGIFAGLFLTRVDFPSTDFGEDVRRTEFDLYLGYQRDINADWAWDAALLHYDYPDSGAFDYSYEELAVNVHYRDLARFGLAVSDNAISGRSSGWSAEIELRRPLGARMQLSGSLGHYALQRADWRDYFYWDLGVSTTVLGVTADLRYFDTDGGAQSFSDAALSRARVVVSLSVGF